MKKCAYCGKKHSDAEVACSIDGQPLVADGPQAQAPKGAKRSGTTIVRGLIGFMVSSIVAGVSAIIAFVTIYLMPPDVSGEPEYYSYAVVMIAAVTFICGGFIGLRGFTARRALGLLWPVVGSYVFMLLLCCGKEASFHEGAPLIAIASVGIAASVGVSLATLRWFPQKGLHEVV